MAAPPPSSSQQQQQMGSANDANKILYDMSQGTMIALCVMLGLTVLPFAICTLKSLGSRFMDRSHGITFGVTHQTFLAFITALVVGTLGVKYTGPAAAEQRIIKGDLNEHPIAKATRIVQIIIGCFFVLGWVVLFSKLCEEVIKKNPIGMARRLSASVIGGI